VEHHHVPGVEDLLLTDTLPPDEDDALHEDRYEVVVELLHEDDDHNEDDVGRQARKLEEMGLLREDAEEVHEHEDEARVAAEQIHEDDCNTWGGQDVVDGLDAAVVLQDAVVDVDELMLLHRRRCFYFLLLEP